MPSWMEPGWHRQVGGQSRPGKYQGLEGMRWGRRVGGRHGRGGTKLEWRPLLGHLCPLGLETSIGFGTSGAA